MLHRELLPLAQQVVLLDFFQSLLLDDLLLSEGNDCGLIKLLCPRTEVEKLATEATETGSEFIRINPSLVKMSEDMKDKMILKVDMKLLTRLSKLCELKRPIAKILDVNPSTLYLCGVEEGCVMVTYLIPKAVADVIFSKGKEFTKEDKREFRYLSIRWLKCHDHIFCFEFEQEVSSYIVTHHNIAVDAEEIASIKLSL